MPTNAVSDLGPRMAPSPTARRGTPADRVERHTALFERCRDLRDPLDRDAAPIARPPAHHRGGPLMTTVGGPDTGLWITADQLGRRRLLTARGRIDHHTAPLLAWEANRQLQRVFAELAGSSFRDELAAVRMQHGAALLQTTDVPISDVARRVGYRQSAQFARAFRRHHGVSPMYLRRVAGRPAGAARG